MIKDFKAFNTSDDNSSDVHPRPILELIYNLSVPIVRLNSTYVLESSTSQDFVALRLSLFISLYALSPTLMLFFFVIETQEGSVSFNVSVFFIIGSPFSILQIAELVVPKSIP